MILEGDEKRRTTYPGGEACGAACVVALERWCRLNLRLRMVNWGVVDRKVHENAQVIQSSWESNINQLEYTVRWGENGNIMGEWDLRPLFFRQRSLALRKTQPGAPGR